MKRGLREDCFLVHEPGVWTSRGADSSHVFLHTYIIGRQIRGIGRLRQSGFRRRNAQFRAVADFAAKSANPVVVAGDFNCTPFSSHFAKLLERGSLKNTATGFELAQHLLAGPNHPAYRPHPRFQRRSHRQSRDRPGDGLGPLPGIGGASGEIWRLTGSKFHVSRSGCAGLQSGQAGQPRKPGLLMTMVSIATQDKPDAQTRSSTDPRLEAIREEVRDAAEEANEPNWDGEHARAVSPETLAVALDLVELLPAARVNPSVSADPDGEISFEWYEGPNQQLMVSVSASRRLSYASIFDGTKSHGAEVFQDQLPAGVLSQIQRVAT